LYGAQHAVGLRRQREQLERYLLAFALAARSS